MKKILLGTSAVALSSMVATTANAAKWDLDWGGYFEAYVGFASVDVDADLDGVDVRQDAEIQFTPTITLDNGLKFGVDVQLEANAGVGNGGTPDVIDESFIFVKGSFGQVLIGSENSAGYKMTFAAPDVTALGVNSGSVSAYVPLSGGFRNPGRSSFVEVDGNNDSQRVTYFTPRFSGFQLGASYARDGVQDGSGPVDLDTNLGNIFDVGANYVNSFGGFDVAVSGRYGTADGGPGQSDPDTYAFGLNLGFSGVTVGGSYAADDGGNEGNDGDFFDVGVSYATGPWAGSITYAHSDLDVPGEADQFIGGVTYKLGPGVKAGATIAYVDSERDDFEAFIVETGFTLNF